MTALFWCSIFTIKLTLLSFRFIFAIWNILLRSDWLCLTHRMLSYDFEETALWVKLKNRLIHSQETFTLTRISSKKVASKLYTLLWVLHKAEEFSQILFIGRGSLTVSLIPRLSHKGHGPKSICTESQTIQIFQMLNLIL